MSPPSRSRRSTRAVGGGGICRCRGAIRERGIVSPSDLGLIREEIEALVELGELTQARELTALLEQEGAKLRPTWTPPMAARARGLIAAAAGDLERAEEELTAAVAGRDSASAWVQGQNLLSLGGSASLRLSGALSVVPSPDSARAASLRRIRRLRR
jgi:hypothetical protein